MIDTMSRRLTSPVLVGRSDPLEQLQAALAGSMAGAPRHLVIGGEAGVGKTRLLARASELAGEAGARVLTGGCVAMGEGGLPFAPYTEIIRGLVAQDGVPAVAAYAGRAAHDLGRLVPALSPEEAPPAQELWAQTRLYDALLDLFGHLAERTPLVVQLEDLHWADAGTLAATSFMMRAVRSEAISVVATFRSDEMTRRHPLRAWLAEVARDDNVDRIDIEPLDRADLAQLVRNILGEDLSPAELADIHERSDGNPFFVEELLAARSEGDEALPTSLRETLMARIDRLPETAQHVISVAGIGGREVEHDALVSVIGRPESEVAQDLRTLVDAGLLVPTRALDGDDAYSFRHALLQESVTDAMLPTEQRRLHVAWAEAIEGHADAASDDSTRLVELAYHWREAHAPRALAASIRAGDAAMDSLSFEIALQEYEAVLSLWDEATASQLVDVDHVAVLERTMRAAYLAAQNRRAVAAGREAIDELGDADPERSTEIRIRYARALWTSGDWSAALEAYEEALELAPPEPALVRIRALGGLAQVYMLHGRFRESRPLCEQAIEQARAAGLRELEGHALNTLGFDLAALGESQAAVEAGDEALRIAIDLGIPDDIGRSYVNRSETQAWFGYPDRAVEYSLEGIRVADEWGVGNSYGAYIGLGAVSFAFESGDWEAAANFLDVADRTGAAGQGAYLYRAIYAMEYLACSGQAAADELLRRVLPLIKDDARTDNDGLIHMGGIELHAFAGRDREAAELAVDGMRHLSGAENQTRLVELARVAAWPVAEVGRRAREAGEASEVARWDAFMRELEESAGDWASTAVDPGERLRRVVQLDLDEIGAHRARMEGTAAAESFGSLAQAWTELERPFRAAMAHRWEAQLADEAGDRDTAVAALRAAHGIAARLGAKPLLERLETLARKLRVRVRDEGPGGGDDGASAPYGLTPRELEVLTLVAAGRTNKQIAGELFISESTAGVHVSNILGKLGVSSRTEAASVALSQGFVSSPGDAAPILGD